MPLIAPPPPMPANDQADLKRIYAQRFSMQVDYRNRVWRILVNHFFRNISRKRPRYLVSRKIPFFCRPFGKQFLVVARA